MNPPDFDKMPSIADLPKDEQQQAEAMSMLLVISALLVKQTWNIGAAVMKIEVKPDGEDMVIRIPKVESVLSEPWLKDLMNRISQIHRLNLVAGAEDENT